MCGIVGAVAGRDVVSILIAGLQALEYRGYDSAGLCVPVDGQLRRLRSAGKVSRLVALQDEARLVATSGISHTRWATHGAPTTGNAHPITSRDRIAVVHGDDGGVGGVLAFVLAALLVNDAEFSGAGDSHQMAIIVPDRLDVVQPDRSLALDLDAVRGH